MFDFLHNPLNSASSLTNNPGNPFRSWWMAGFECTDKLNAFGNRVDFAEITGHLKNIDTDYHNLSEFNITTVREGIRWSQVERIPYQYDWSTVSYMIEHGKKQGIQQIWDLCHFGFPDDLTPLHPMFARRFAALCRAFVLFYRSIQPDVPLIVTPINEVSFLSWLGGEVRGTSPYCIRLGWEVKYALMRAYIEGVAALREADPDIRILTTDPLVNIIAPPDASEKEIADASFAHFNQYQAIDILCGRICPELGGKPEYLDIIGFNYYYNNQWETITNRILPWVNDSNDPRWRSLSSLIIEGYQRYERPLVITETGHCGEHRPDWIRAVTIECGKAIQAGIPLWGVCLYPILDRPDWDHMYPWHNCGLWDRVSADDRQSERILHKPLAVELLNCQDYITKITRTDNPSIIHFHDYPEIPVQTDNRKLNPVMPIR